MGGKIAVVGAGAIGLYYGARMAAAGEDVRFLLRSDYDAVIQEGVWVESVHGDLHLPSVKAYRTSEEIGPVDWVIVAWKATANHNFEPILGPLLGPNTKILTLQNGLGNDVSLGELFGRDRVLGGLCFVCINRVGPGRVVHTAGGKITVGELEPIEDHARARKVASALNAAGIPSEAAESLPQAQWRKLVWNVPFNGLAIVEGGLTTDQILELEGGEEEVVSLMREVIAVARVKGHEVDPSVIEFEIERTRPMGAYRPSSMIDFVEGKPVEYEAIWGEPLRQAKEAGVEVPHLEKLAARLRNCLAR
ncbi:MAG: 2-dehydropantoate 2-reductase [Verrucomicrobiales bacterium]